MKTIHSLYVSQGFDFCNFPASWWNSSWWWETIKDLPSEGYQKLVEHLQPLSATGRDYRSLADRMGYSNQYIQWLESTDNPVVNLLRTFRENDRKISELTSLLKEMERNDVLEELQPYIGQWNAAYKLGRIVCLTWGLPVNTDTKRSCHSVRIIRVSVLSRLSEKMSQTTVLSIWRLKQTFSQRL